MKPLIFALTAILSLTVGVTAAPAADFSDQKGQPAEAVKYFRVIGSHPLGLRCVICEIDYRQKKSASGLPMPNGGMVPVVRDTAIEALLVGYSKKPASGEIIKISAEEIGTKDLGPEYGGQIVKLFRAK